LEEPLKQPALIMVDEFDELFSKVDEALLAIFELFTHPRSKLTLVGTSNSMEFIEKVSHKFKSTIP
jgi:Cdc6-like AAA superfamily ATPase